eukprot:gene10232-12105_t
MVALGIRMQDELACRLVDGKIVFNEDFVDPAQYYDGFAKDLDADGLGDSLKAAKFQNKRLPTHVWKKLKERKVEIKKKIAKQRG